MGIYAAPGAGPMCHKNYLYPVVVICFQST